MTAALQILITNSFLQLLKLVIEYGVSDRGASLLSTPLLDDFGLIEKNCSDNIIIDRYVFFLVYSRQLIKCVILTYVSFKISNIYYNHADEFESNIILFHNPLPKAQSSLRES